MNKILNIYSYVKNKERAGDILKKNETHSSNKQNSNVKSDDYQQKKHELEMNQRDDAEQSHTSLNKQTLNSSQTRESIAYDFIDYEDDYDIIEKNDILSDNMHNSKQSTSDYGLNNQRTSENFQYNRSISMNIDNHQSEIANIQRRKSLQMNLEIDTNKSREYPNNKSIIKDFQENNLLPIESMNNNSDKQISQLEEFEEKKIKCDHYSPIFRLVEPTCEGIRSRIDLLGELISCNKVDSIDEMYDEMKEIIAATERNDRFQSDLYGKRLLELTTAVRSNLNIDLYNLDVEIQRQFGLYSVEVTGDGLQKPDVYHSELREGAILQVLNDIPYYSTVLRPGEKVSEKELKDWVNSMADPNTYGDEMANIAVADRYHIQLIIFRAGELLTVVNPRDGYVKHTAFLINVGTHYKALVPRCELEEARRNSERLSKHNKLNLLSTSTN
ncbi:unnamed protein product [Rotaria sp. Silwood2]|nr:unnamed protein product [Rotaria sp. Silwood2]